MPGITYADSLEHIHRDREESDGPLPDVGPSKAPRGDKVKWEHHKSTLYDLYMKKAKTLPEVMRIMKDDYGHKASVKQCMSVPVAAIRRYMALHRYQLGEKWGWKKYGLGGGKPLQTRINKSRRPTSPGKLHEVPFELDFHDQDTTPLQEQLSQVFADQWLDDKSLNTLRACSDVWRCVRPCLRWCQAEIQNSETQTVRFEEPALGETDGPDKYYSAIQICIILLHRYNDTPSGPSRYRNWGHIAKSTIGFRPVGMLLIMSALIVTIAANVWDPATTSPSELEIAKLGIETAVHWEDAILVAEFCDEFEAILKDDNTLRDAIQRYIAHNWGDAPINDHLVVGQMHFDDSWVWDETMENQAILTGGDLSNFTEYQPSEIGHTVFSRC